MGFWGTLTGRELLEKVDEYSSVLGEVVLGLHRETEEHSAKIVELCANIEDLRRVLSTLQERVQSMEAQQSEVLASIQNLHVQTQERFARLTGTLSEVSAQLEHQHLQITLLQDQLKTLSEAVAPLNETVTKLQMSLSSLEETLYQSSKQQQALYNELNQRVDSLSPMEIDNKLAQIKTKMFWMCGISYILILMVGALLWIRG